MYKICSLNPDSIIFFPIFIIFLLLNVFATNLDKSTYISSGLHKAQIINNPVFHLHKLSHWKVFRAIMSMDLSSSMTTMSPSGTPPEGHIYGSS